MYALQTLSHSARTIQNRAHAAKFGQPDSKLRPAFFAYCKRSWRSTMVAAVRLAVQGNRQGNRIPL